MSRAMRRHPKRILMTADTLGGVWTYAVELAHVLWKHDIEVVLATMGAPLSAQQRADLRQIPGAELHESTFKLEWMEHPWDDVARAGEWLLRLEEELEPDIVHLNGYAHGALPWKAPRLVVGHSCVLSWWEAVLKEPAPPEWKRYRHEVKRGIAAADAVVVPTASMRDALARHYHSDIACSIIPNGRNTELFAPGIKEALVLTAGRLWDRAKNVAALMESAPLLSWPLYIAGEECPPSGGGDTAAGRHSAVRRLGRLPASGIASWMSRASLYAFPAYYEPFGLSVLEAGLSGCALVLGDIPSLRELWHDAALFVSPDDTSMIREAIETLIRNAAYRQEMAERARVRAQEFTPRRMAAGYLAVYERMVQSAAAPASETEGQCVS
ncbi:MAG: glycosyltransferase family 4 protein [Nitrospirota bacterium]